ncbi:hypothetical protein JHN63_02055 [Streptomyces sp. MBT65]|uniref:hypothetical protein n=1 Tax=Streptomyces sp. MBT65 TaxID=1488395 RepID=UPI00190E48E8|nr:hypothetical protein [Streptomyces sp. MBT65]MBK3572625.1 hypothetical protein [Streptomyces sp. MBT65]
MRVPALPGLIVLAALGCLALGLICFAAAGVLCLREAFRKARANVAAALSSVDAPSAPEALRDMAKTLRYIDPTGFREAADCCEAQAFALEHTTQPADPSGRGAQ